MSEIDLESVKCFLLNLQDDICTAIQPHEPEVRFKEDQWVREGGGGGRSRVLEEGEVIEKGGVNFSHVYGTELPPSATANRPELVGRSFQALGVSVVMHPRNPNVPTTHANVRFFIAEKEGSEPVWWFGGGFDLTPYYGNREDAKAWHQNAQDLCGPYGSEVYPNYKKWCDQYFYIKHRDEPRGIGGLFFDDLNEWGFDKSFAFVKAVGNGFISGYQPLLAKHKGDPYTSDQRQWQLYRRGRYVEFNLVYDRGTIFGLQTGGRTESILMSLPAEVHWRYDYHPQEGSAEAVFLKEFLRVQDWL